MTARKYERNGILAMDPRALEYSFEDVAYGTLEMSNDADAIIVDIRGPLDHHAGTWCDSYDAILERVAKACAYSQRHVILRVDSPGGAVSGCFEAARAIRERCLSAGKQLTAYVDGQACSAAYALASAASTIVVPPTGMVGSIGVIDARVDVSALNAAQGVRIAFITSGARKADGNPNLALSDEELEDRQTVVDALAGVFFELVADMRGADASKFQALEARVLPGIAAVKGGLADEVMSFDQLLASLAGGVVMGMKEARAALEDIAKGDGDDAAAAKRALAAMDEKEEPEAEGEDAPKGDDEAPKEEEKPAEARAVGSVSAATAGDLASIVSDLGKQVTALKAQNERSEKGALLASRPDLDAGLRKVLATKPLAEVKEIVSAIPKPKAPKPAATAVVQATRGEGQVDVAVVANEQTAQMDAAMGLTKYEMSSRREGNAMVFGVMPVKQTAGDAGKVGGK